MRTWLNLTGGCFNESDHSTASEQLCESSDYNLDWEKIESLETDIEGSIVDNQECQYTRSHINVSTSDHRCWFSHEHESQPTSTKSNDGGKSKRMEPVHLSIFIQPRFDCHRSLQGHSQRLQFGCIGEGSSQKVDQKGWKTHHAPSLCYLVAKTLKLNTMLSLSLAIGLVLVRKLVVGNSASGISSNPWIFHLHSLTYVPGTYLVYELLGTSPGTCTQSEKSQSTASLSTWPVKIRRSFLEIGFFFFWLIFTQTGILAMLCGKSNYHCDALQLPLV